MKEKLYDVEVYELVRTMVYSVPGHTAKEAGEKVKNGVRGSGVYRRTIKSVRLVSSQ